jgi:hypothetical protein
MHQLGSMGAIPQPAAKFLGGGVADLFSGKVPFGIAPSWSQLDTNLGRAIGYYPSLPASSQQSQR